MLSVENINQYYGGSHTLRGVSITAEPGRCTALLGRNGVGKTTLLKCMMGVLPVSSGKIVFDGADITKLSPHARAARGIALRAAGPRDLSAADRRGEHPDGDGDQAGRQRAKRINADGLRAVPGAQGDARPTRRRPVGRSAAAARDRTRDGRRSEADHPRRADGGHPAIDHQGHRARDPHAARTRRHRDRARASSTTTSRARSPTSSWCCRAARSCGPARARRWKATRSASCWRSDADLPSATDVPTKPQIP